MKRGNVKEREEKGKKKKKKNPKGSTSGLVAQCMAHKLGVHGTRDKGLCI